uniref:Uncharacterized protein n=2 Tax=Haematobia irritans TaxID=7368 RepID=A0A1L8EIL9_HAEIR
MNSGFGYNNPSGTIKNFQCLRVLTYWAGCFGMVQSLIFIGLTITGILSYNCVISIYETFNYSSVIPTVFMALYFKSTCTPDSFPAYENEFIKTKTILDPEDILIWDCVYLGVSVCWLIASALILIYVKKDNRKSTIGVSITWVILTFCICAMDLSLGVIFGIDYGRFKSEAADFNLSTVYSGDIEPQAAQILAAMVVSISMMIISFKGFVLWLINIVLAIYLLVKAVFIINDNDGTDNLFMPHKDSSGDILATRPPINAYQEERKPEIMATVFANEAFIPDNTTSEDTIEINQEVITRAARMSKDASFQERRFRNLDNFQQYPPRSRPESTIPEQQEPATNFRNGFPAPDYTPPMQRAAQNRNNLYQ